MQMRILWLLVANVLFSSSLLSGAIDQLNQDKTEIYHKNLEFFQKKLLAEHPVILALFSSTGGRLILYRPGHEPLWAPRVPQEYELFKSIGHSTLALYSFMITYNSSSRASLETYLKHNQEALSSLESEEDMEIILQNNIEAIKSCLENDSITLESIRKYITKQLPYIKKIMERGAHLQVGHWIEVLNEWKELLGDSFENAYGVVNSAYVTRSRNILYTVLAQFFREEAFNDRLLLLETTDFMISPEAILAELTRIVSDRTIGELFFDGKFEMDVELLGKAARKALETHADKLKEPLLLPPLRRADDLARWPW